MQVLGKYQIVEELGQGNFATVYRAIDTTLKREVALKILDPLLFRDPTFVQRFQQEAITAANLDHPNIISVFEIDEVEDRYYIAMKFVDGQSLADMIQIHGAISISNTLAIAKQVGLAMDCIHKRGLVHRDIKPSNILVDKHDQAMLSDFGLVRAAEGSRLSSQGVIVGTPSYMAPEQAEGETVDARTDIYAMGVVLYEMVTGQLPFSTDSPATTLYQQVHKDPQAPSFVNPQVTSNVDRVILRALKKDPEARYQTASHLVNDLTQAASGRSQGLDADQRSSSQLVQPKPKKRQWALKTTLGCVIVSLCAFVVGGGYLAWRSDLLDNLGPVIMTSTETPEPTLTARPPTLSSEQVSPSQEPGLEPTFTSAPVPVQTEELDPTATSVVTVGATNVTNTPVSTSKEISFFGESKNIDDLIVNVAPPDYDSGCDGTLDIEVSLSNETHSPIVLGFGTEDIRLLGNGEDHLSLYGDSGAATPRCYNGFELSTLAPRSTATFALRTIDSLGDYEYIDLVFGENTGRLSEEKWRLDLTREYDLERTFFGETISIEGLQVYVGDEDYFPGCDGTIGFQIKLHNTTDQPIVLGMRSNDLKLYGSNHTELSLYSKLGKQSEECYGSFTLETVEAGETLIAVRTTSSLAEISYVDFVFESDNRLNGLRWRLVLPR
jgi:serine/threonine protein kinase